MCFASNYLGRAHNAYKSWGADVKQLQAEYQGLMLEEFSSQLQAPVSSKLKGRARFEMYSKVARDSLSLPF